MQISLRVKRLVVLADARIAIWLAVRSVFFAAFFLPLLVPRPVAGSLTPTPTSTPTTTPTSTPTETPSASPASDAGSFAAAVGTNAQADYVAKHFWLAFGAVALNPFDFDEVTPDASPGATAVPAGVMASPLPTMEAAATPAIRLNTGGADVRPYLEGGFRYRWSWLDRYPVTVAARREGIAALGLAEREELRTLRSELKKAVADNDASKVQQIKDRIAVLYRDVATSVRAARQKWATNQGKFYVYDPPAAWKIVEDSICGWHGNATPEPSNAQTIDPTHRAGCAPDRFSWVIPDDWVVRLGYVFNQSDGLGASTLAGASSFYSEIATGWNLMNLGFATAHEYETPIRGSINFEPDLVLTSDNDLLQVHTRALFGAAFAFGVPLDMLPGAESDIPPEDVELDSIPIIEFMVRLGPVLVDSPSYADNSTRLVKVRNEKPDFDLEWGYGMDAELNVPLGLVPGYIMLRGTLNAGIDPSSWVLQAGYTIPLWNFVRAVAPQTRPPQ